MINRDRMRITMSHQVTLKNVTDQFEEFTIKTNTTNSQPQTHLNPLGNPNRPPGEE